MLTAVVVLYLLLGTLAGYVTARLYRQFKGTRTVRLRFFLIVSAVAHSSRCPLQLQMMLAALVSVPAVLLTLYFAANVVLWMHASSAGLSAPMVVAVFALWLAHSVLVVLGMLVGLRAGVLPPPTAVNNIPRFIPKQPWYNNRLLVFLAAGLIPFSVFWIELYYMLQVTHRRPFWWRSALTLVLAQAVWLQHWISTFAFVFVALLFLSCATAFVTVLAVFLRLRTEDYHWWWRAFTVGCAPAVYIFFYCLYFVRYMALVSAASLALYVLQSLIICVALALFLGGVGFFASVLFVSTIFSNLPGID